MSLAEGGLGNIASGSLTDLISWRATLLTNLPRGSALGFRNLTHYIARCLLESGGFRPVLHSQLR